MQVFKILVSLVFMMWTIAANAETNNRIETYFCVYSKNPAPESMTYLYSHEGRLCMAGNGVNSPLSFPHADGEGVAVTGKIKVEEGSHLSCNIDWEHFSTHEKIEDVRRVEWKTENACYNDNGGVNPHVWDIMISGIAIWAESSITNFHVADSASAQLKWANLKKSGQNVTIDLSNGLGKTPLNICPGRAICSMKEMDMRDTGKIFFIFNLDDMNK